MADRLTDDQLQWCTVRWPICCDDENCGDRLAGLAFAELQSLRALLATPMPCGFDQPRVGPSTDPNVVGDVIAFDDSEYTRDEAIAIGAAWIRAALTLPEDA